MMSGPGNLMAGGGSPALLAYFDATAAASAATGLVTLPAWMHYTCATSGRSAQVSASARVDGIASNGPIAWFLGGKLTLGIECSRKNWVADPKLRTPTFKDTGVTMSASGTDPAGGTSTKLAYTGAGSSGNYRAIQNVIVPSVNGVIYTLSMWGKQDAGGFPLYLSTNRATPDALKVSLALGASWARTVQRGTGNGSANVQAGLWGVANESGDCYIDGAQVESGVQYPSNLIGGGVTRAAAALSADSALVAPGGWIHKHRIDFVTPYAQNETVGDHYLFGAAGAGVYFKQSDLKVYADFGGLVALSSGALTFAQGTELSVEYAYAPGVRSLKIVRVSDSTTLYDSGSVAHAGSALSFSSTIPLLDATNECGGLVSFLAARR